MRLGDALPFCCGMTERQVFYSLDDQAGRPVVFILAGHTPPSECAGLIEAFAAGAAEFGRRGADVRVLAAVGTAGWSTAEIAPGVGVVHCLDTSIFQAAGACPAVLTADRALRLVHAGDGRDPAAAVDQALAAIDALPNETARQVFCPAPVLIRQALFDPGLCARLIAHFEAGPHEAGAMASEDAHGAQVNRVDAAKKHRRDLLLDAGEPLQAEVIAAFATRLAPDITKAFNVQVAHIDRILIARYDDAGGYFRRHRDNTSAHLAWREFAVSVNLNTGDYEGGELLFPEFNDHRHDPPAGAALVFSASLLHEAASVTRGCRYVLLTFLHSDAAEARRVQMLAAA